MNTRIEVLLKLLLEELSAVRKINAIKTSMSMSPIQDPHRKFITEQAKKGCYNESEPSYAKLLDIPKEEKPSRR